MRTKLQLWPIIALIFMGVVELPSCTQAAAEIAPHPSCSADMLDVRVLPLLEPKTVTGIRAIVIELQNRTKSICKLPSAPFIGFLPLSGADNFTASDFQDDSEAAQEFQQKQNILAPGELAHVIAAWPSRASWNSFPGCFSRDRLALSFGFNEPPLLEIEHLWARLCDRVYVSRFRRGHYAGGGIPAEWMRRFQAQQKDFAVPGLLVDQTSVGKPLIGLETMAQRVMLDDAFYSQLFLDLPEQEFDCPFVVLRKRQADGKTRVYLNHCEDPTPEERVRPPLREKKVTVMLYMAGLGMQPEWPGQVEYEVISLVSDEETRKYAVASAQVMVMDPDPPGLPSVDSPSPDCQAAQLQPAELPPIPGGPWHEAHIYNVTNVSAQTCRVGGVPSLQLLYPQGQGHTGDPKPCPNCSDPLFQPRPSGWIDLKPGDSAHFLFGATRFDQDSGKWRMKCDVPGLQLIMPEENQTLPLTFGAGTCAAITVSAWRMGKYDGDPLNIDYNKRDEKWKAAVESAPLPAECEKADFSKTGRPVIFPDQNGLEFGISVEREHFVKGKPVGVHVWSVNPTDKPITYLSCPPPFETDVFDVYGHRLLSSAEQKERENQDKGLRSVSVCTATILMTMAPHTCSAPEAAEDISQQYALPPGEYLITRKSASSAAASGPTLLREREQQTRAGVVISIDPQ